MKKVLLILALAAIAAGGIGAPQLAAQQAEAGTWGVSAGAELNMNSGNHSDLHGAAALGFGVHAGGEYNINEQYAAGLNLNISFSDLTAFEGAGFFRWYFLKNLRIFAQADLGLWAGNDPYTDSVKFLGGASAGVRFPLPVDNLYIEPYARFGYPFLFGGGVTAVYLIPHKKTQSDSVWTDTDAEGRMHIAVSVTFAPDSAGFEELSPETLERNRAALQSVADILKKTKYSKIIAQGHANPTTPEGPQREEEEASLRELSEARANAIVELLKQKPYQVKFKNLTVEGQGGTKTIAPYNDSQNNWKNRRVEFIVIR